MKSSLSLSLLVALALLAPSAAAQVFGHQDPPPMTDEQRRFERLTGEADALAIKARKLLRARRLDEAESLAREANALSRSVAFPCYKADDVIAEVAMLQGEPLRALAQLREPQAGERGTMTKALALVTVGRSQDAAQILVGVTGTAENPKRWRISHSECWILPMDRDLSPERLAATAYVLRAARQIDWGGEEALDDLRAAERLDPSGSAVRLLLGKDFLNRHQFDEAQRYYTRAAAINEPHTRKEGIQGLERVKVARAAWEKDKAGGSKRS